MRAGTARFILLSYVVGVVVGQAPPFPDPTITFDSKGLTFSLPDDGYSLVAYHYAVNAPLPGTSGGGTNVDVTRANRGNWVHTDRGVTLVNGDTVNYWVYVVKNGVGYQILDRSWTFGSAPTAPPTQTPTPVTNSPTTADVTTRDVTPVTTDDVTPSATTPSGRQPPVSGSCNCDGIVDDSTCTTFPCLIFEDNFDFLNMRVWEHEITAGGGGNWEFQYYTNNRSNSYTRDGVLYMKPTLTSNARATENLETGTLDLWGSNPADVCTGNQWWGCQRQGQPGAVLNPIQSARLRSSRGFNFRYGKVEVEAKLPVGDWLWPAIWMMPRYNAYGGWPASGEVDIMESRGNTNYNHQGQSVGVDSVGSTLHFGTNWSTNRWSAAHVTTRKATGTYGDGFHRYGVEWDTTKIAFTLDGVETLRLTPGAGGFWELGGLNTLPPGYQNPWEGATRMAPFDQEFFLILNVAVGGTAYFPDVFTNQPYPKPWSDSSGNAATDFWNARNLWYPTWTPDLNNGEAAALKVNYVKVWKMQPDP